MCEENRKLMEKCDQLKEERERLKEENNKLEMAIEKKEELKRKLEEEQTCLRNLEVQKDQEKMELKCNMKIYRIDSLVQRKRETFSSPHAQSSQNDSKRLTLIMMLNLRHKRKLLKARTTN